MAAKSFGKVFVARDKKNKFFRNFDITQNINVITVQSTLHYLKFSYTLFVILAYTNSYIHTDVMIKVRYMKRYWEIEGK